MQQKTVAGYRIRIVGDSESDAPDAYRVEIRRGNRLLLQQDAGSWGRFSFPKWVPPDGADIIGRGRPQLVIEQDTGGHCCRAWLIYELGPGPELVAQLEGRFNESVQFEQRPGLGWIAHLYDTIFMYWNAGSPQSPWAPITVTYRDQGFHLVPELMRTPRWSAKLIDQAVDSVRSDFAYCSRGDSCLPSSLWAVMLSLVYSGHLDQAQEFFERAWPMQPDKGWKHAYWEQKSYAASPEGRQQFWTEFMAQLAYSPYWADVQAMNALPPLPGQLDRLPDMAACWLGVSDKCP
ncbi:MAG: hypothetical protein JO128_09690 [Alphaproteobacteria bacterium]|nr:hypothetical protein [Alphaproteobacteria bacterium]